MNRMSLAVSRRDARDFALAERLFDALRVSGFDGVGITRSSYGPGESSALDIIEAEARALGLATERDAGANLVVTLGGSDPRLPCIACGSHMDSVPQGGNFDGAAGVVAGLLVLARLMREGRVPRRSIKLFALRGEESARFGKAYLGSSALFGTLTPGDLATTAADDGRTLADCMRATGADVDRIARGEALIDPASILAWLELHIEQGPILVARDLPIAVVTAIRGNIRHRAITCLGEPGHSGAVPRWLRHDAVFAVAELVTRLDHQWRTLLERGHDLVVTSGVFGTDPIEHAIARIPGSLRFSLDIRSQSPETLEAFYALFLSECEQIRAKRGVQFVLDQRLETAPAIMDTGWIDGLRDAARALGVPDETMPSGAGHDSATFANAGIPAAMIFVRNSHGSHNPDESLDIDDFVTGVNVMYNAIEKASFS